MPKRRIVPFENDRVLLRLLDITDLPLTLSWRNQAEIRKWFVNSDVITAAGHYEWYKRYELMDNDFVFIIVAKDLDNLPVGQISLYRIDWNLATAEYGRIMIGESLAKGKGYARQSTKLLIGYGLEGLKLKEITLEVREDNMPAIAVYRSTGFVEEKRKSGFITMCISSTQYHGANNDSS